MPLDGGRVSNAMGVPINQWLINQLNERSKQMGIDKRDTDNIIYQGNKTAWIRLVSSVDIIKYQDRSHFSDMGLLLSDKSDLAKKFVLQGGSSIYDNGKYSQRAGLGEAYNVTGGWKETEKYGYRPMPGITSVKVTTQGKMGSIRSADIQIKVWDKDQLDIIDALFFKLGYTLFLEWGHTYYYESGGTKVKSSEEYSIDPFEEGLTKERIYNKISKNVIDSQGNYDAMLGMVTNFNFTYNQEGGYDCTIKLMALGVLASGIKMNNPKVMPNIQEATIKQLVQTLIKIYEEEEARKKALLDAQNKVDAPPAEVGKTAEEFIKTYLKYDSKTDPKNPGGGQVSYPASAPINLDKADFSFNTTGYGWVYFIRKLKGFIVADQEKNTKIKISPDLLIKLKGTKLQGKLIDLSDPRIWNMSGEYLESAKDIIKSPITATLNLLTFAVQVLNPFDDGEDQPTELQKNNDTANTTITYVSTNGLNYEISIKRNQWGYSNKRNILSSYSNTANGLLSYTNAAYEYIDTPTFTKQLISVLSNTNNEYQILDIDTTPLKAKTSISINVPFIRRVKVSINETKKIDDLGREVVIPGSVADEDVQFIVPVTITFDNSDFIKSFSVPSTVKEPTDFIGKTVSEEKVEPAASEAQQTNESQPPLEVSEIQKSEALKYQSAFEVIIRTIQLYSLDNSIKSGIETNNVVSVLDLTSKNHYSTFTKELFKAGIFSNILNDLLGEINPKTQAFEINLAKIKQECDEYDQQINQNFDTNKMIKLRSKFGFNFSLMGNQTTATKLYQNSAWVNYSDLMTTYTIPYKYNAGVFEGTQVNHPVYVKLGFVIMIINHICNIYDVKKQEENTTPLLYFDFNPKTNICLSNAKQLSTNPYDILIPFEGFNSDFKAIIDPSVIDGDYIKAAEGATERTKIYTPEDKENGDRLSVSLPKFKIIDSTDKTEAYRGKTMNVLISTDYLLKMVSSYTKQDQSNDIYAKEFIEQILFDVNKYLGDFNMFRLAYDDAGNTMHITDDQMTPNIEREYVDITNKTEFPLFGLGSLARTLEIRTDVSSKLSNMIAISANSTAPGLSSLSKTSDSFGFYNLGYTDRYIADRGELQVTRSLPTNAMINSAIQFNKAIETYYSDTTPAESSVSHATNYFIERMSKIKGAEKGSRSSAVIPVSLNFSTDGLSGLGMGQAFTISKEFLPYTYDLSLRDPYGESDKTNTVGFVVVGLDQTIEGNQWLSNVRANMMFLKKRQDFVQDSLRTEFAPAKGFKSTEPRQFEFSGQTILPSSVRKSVTFQDFIAQPGVKDKVESIAAELGVKSDDLYIIFKAESGFDHTIENSIGAVGLIQFLRSTAEGLGTTTTALKSMTALEQLDYVRKYFIPGKGLYKNAYDLYLWTFFPLALGKPSNFIIQTAKQSAKLISEQNPGIARRAGKNPGDPLTVADFYKYVSTLLV